jgi:hypothetical protein
MEVAVIVKRSLCNHSIAVFTFLSLISVGALAQSTNRLTLETGGPADLKGASRVYLHTDDPALASRLAAGLEKLPVQMVTDPSEAEIVLLTSAMPSTAPDFGVPDIYRAPEPKQGTAALTAAVLRTVSDGKYRLVYSQEFPAAAGRQATDELLTQFAQLYAAAQAP